MPSLLLSPRVSPDSVRMKAAAETAGWQVIQMPRWGEFPPEPSDAYYGESLYGRLMQQEGRLKGSLIDHPEDWLPRLPWHLRRRAVHLLPLGEVVTRWGEQLLFCKPVDEKSFLAGLYASPAELPHYLGNDEKVLVASPVIWADEYRVFLLNGKAQSVSRYSRFGCLDVGRDPKCSRAGAVAEEAFAAIPGLPAGLVIDVGTVGGEWAVVEANQAWGSGLYACDETMVLPVVAASIGSNTTSCA